MDRRDLSIVGVVVLVTVASWSASIAYDTDGRDADSRAQGRLWAQLNQPTAAECEIEMLRISGPEIIGGSWLQGCLAPPAR